MSSTFSKTELDAAFSRMLSDRRDYIAAGNVYALAPDERDEALAFLEIRPIHTVFMAGLILDNGLTSPLNRGEFYGHRDDDGALQGVALIGQKNVIEARTEMAFMSLSTLALEHPRLQLIRGEEPRMELLLAHLESLRRMPRLVCRELLLEQTAVAEEFEPVEALCCATSEDLDEVIAINSAMAFEENGTNPLKRDLMGMTERTSRRIERGRVFVLSQGGRIIFKTDLLSVTPQALYIEGVYVHPEERGRGLGSRCLTELGRLLLKRAPSITLVANQDNPRAIKLYRRINYEPRSPYLTIYF